MDPESSRGSLDGSIGLNTRQSKKSWVTKQGKFGRGPFANESYEGESICMG